MVKTQRLHCCDLGSIPGRGHNQKKKKKKNLSQAPKQTNIHMLNPQTTMWLSLEIGSL